MSELSEKIRKRREETDFDKLQANFRKNYNPGFLSSVGHNLLGGVEALGGGVAKGLGQFFQSDTLEDIGDNLSNDAQNLNEIYGTNEKYKDMGFFDRLTSLDYLTDPRGLTASVTNGFGSSLPLLALTAAFPEFTIPGAIARGGAAKLLGEAGANWVARKGIDKFLNAGTKFATVSTPFDALAAQSEMIEYLRRQGYSESEITRRIIDGMIEEYPMDMLANMASGGLLMGKLPFMQGSSLSKRILKGIGATGLDMFLGGNQEMYQDQVMKRHANLPAGTLFNPLPEEEQTRTEAMFGEMFPGVVATARDAVFGDSKAQEPPEEEQSQEFDLEQYAKPYLGQKMPSGANGCVEAVTRIGKGYSPFLQNEYDNGENNVLNLVNHAKESGIDVIPFDANKLSKGDVIVYDDRQHVVIYDGNGGYYGNSTKRMQVFHGNDYNAMDREPTEIIKTGSGSVQESNQNNYDPNYSEIENRMWQNAQHVAKRMKDEFGWDVDPALIYGQWYHESGGFKSRAAKEINNFAGLMQKEPNGEENRQTDGDLYFKMYDSPEQFADDYVDSFMNPRLYPEMANVKTAEDFRDMLFRTGYVNEGSYDGYLADIKYGMANHPNVGYNGGRVTPTTEKEAGAENQSNQTETPRPLFDLNDLINQDNIESGLTNAIVSDYLKQLQQSGNENQKNLANQMLDQDGEFRFTPENLNQVVQTEGQNIVDFAIENEGRYLAPQEVRERLAQQQLLRKANALYANDFDTARDADEKINYWMNYGRKPKDSKPDEIKSKKPPEWKIPQKGMTQEEKDNRMQELLARRLTAEMQGDQNAIKQIETQMKQLRSAPIIDNKPSENPVQNPPTDQTQQPTEEQSQIPPVEENQPKPRRTPPEILDAVKLTGKKPLDAGTLHVETMEDGNIKLLGKRKPPKSNRRKKPSEEPNAIRDLVSIAKEIGGTYNSRSKTFNFQNPEDAELFSQTAFAYLDNGFESLDKEPTVETKPWDNVDSNKDEIPQNPIEQNPIRDDKKYPDKGDQEIPPEPPEQKVFTRPEQMLQKWFEKNDPKADKNPEIADVMGRAWQDVSKAMRGTNRSGEQVDAVRKILDQADREIAEIEGLNRRANANETPLSEEKPPSFETKQYQNKKDVNGSLSDILNQEKPASDDDQNQNGISDEAERIFSEWWNRRAKDRKNPKIAQIMDDTQDRVLEQLSETSNFDNQVRIVKREIDRAENIIARIRPWDKYRDEEKMNEKDESSPDNEIKEIPDKDFEESDRDILKQDAPKKNPDKDVTGDPDEILNRAQMSKKSRAKKLQGKAIRKLNPVQDYGDDIHEEDEDEDEIRDDYSDEVEEEDDELIDEPEPETQKKSSEKITGNNADEILNQSQKKKSKKEKPKGDLESIHKKYSEKLQQAVKVSNESLKQAKKDFDKQNPRHGSYPVEIYLEELKKLHKNASKIIKDAIKATGMNKSYSEDLIATEKDFYSNAKEELKKADQKFHDTGIYRDFDYEIAVDTYGMQINDLARRLEITDKQREEYAQKQSQGADQTREELRKIGTELLDWDEQRIERQKDLPSKPFERIDELVDDLTSALENKVLSADEFLYDYDVKKYKKEFQEIKEFFEEILNETKDAETSDKALISDGQQTSQGEQTQQTESKKPESNKKNVVDPDTFGTLEDFEKDAEELAKLLGVQRKVKQQETSPTTAKLVDFVDDSDESLDAELKILRTEMSKISANPVFNPKLWKSALKIGAIYVQRGINDFANWTKQMTDSIGDGINPWLKSIWDTITSIPEGSKFDDQQMTLISKMIGNLYARGTRDKSAIKKAFEDQFGTDIAAQLEPMIDASFKGISTFFDEQENSQQTKNESKAEPKPADEYFDLFKQYNDRQTQQSLTPEERERIESEVKNPDVTLKESKSLFGDRHASYKIGDREVDATQAKYFNFLRYLTGGKFLKGMGSYSFYPTLLENLPQKTRQTNYEFLQPFFDRKLEDNPELKRIVDTVLKTESSKVPWNRNNSLSTVSKQPSSIQSWLTGIWKSSRKEQLGIIAKTLFDRWYYYELGENPTEADYKATDNKVKQFQSLLIDFRQENISENEFLKHVKDLIEYEEDVEDGRDISKSEGSSGGHRGMESRSGREIDETREENGDQDSGGISGENDGLSGRTGTVSARKNESQQQSDGSNRESGTSKNDGARDSERGNQQTPASRDNGSIIPKNYRATDDADIGGGTKGEKIKRNMEAVRLLAKLEEENRDATPDEQKILARYTGWGGLKTFFGDERFKGLRDELKRLVGNKAFIAASASVKNAHYTSPEVIKAMWQGIEKLGFKGGRILEPSMGVGNMFAFMNPAVMDRSTLVGVEMDSITGRIAQKLYPNASIHVEPYQNQSFPDNMFDVAIGNVPFSSQVLIEDPRYTYNGDQNFNVHNYFFAKTLDKVRPGGLIAFITSTGTMQTKGDQAQAIREKMNEQADLIAAFKLPSTAFEKNAGTSVTTDLLIFQKRLDPRKPSEHAQQWQKVKGKEYQGYVYDLNEYFIKHEDHLLGNPTKDTLYPESGRMALDGDSSEAIQKLSEFMQNLPTIYEPQGRQTAKDTLEATKNLITDNAQKEGAFIERDGKIYQRLDGKLVEQSKNKQLISDFEDLRRKVDVVLKSQLDPKTSDDNLNKARKELNESYDQFYKRHGYINSPANMKVLGGNPNYGRVAAIERYTPADKKKGIKESGEKADIFKKRIVGAVEEIVHVDTSSDALTASLSKFGRVDLNYMTQLSGKDSDTLIQELGNAVYEDPITGEQIIAEEYLSGDVKTKLEQAELVVKGEPRFKRNVEALKEVIPADLTEQDIRASLGSTWIPKEYFEEFLEDELGVQEYGGRVELVNAKTDAYNPDSPSQWKFVIDKPDKRLYVPARAKEYETAKMSFVEVFLHAINNKTAYITKKTGEKDENGREKIRKDDEATQVANDAIYRLRNRFEQWIYENADRRKEIVRIYNDKFNREVNRLYNENGILSFPGLAKEVADKLYPHQRNAIWRILQRGNTLLAHVVGAGKTWTMQIAAMEAKRMGLIRKSMFVVPKNVLRQAERDFYSVYPNAKILVIESSDLPGVDLDAELDEKQQAKLAKRNATLSRIATEDWDAIIIEHNMFQRLPLGEQAQALHIEESTRAIEEEMLNGEPKTQRKITALANKLDAKTEKAKGDFNKEKWAESIPFEELGIDQIFVDESDLFKNLHFDTAMIGRNSKIAGLSNSNSARSADMLTKTQWMNLIHPNRGVVFATGTPISNTLNEIYTTMRYLIPNKMKELGIDQFDDWADVFGRPVQSVELDPKGEGFREVTRLNLTNLKTLSKLFSEFADVKTVDDLPEIKEARPNLETGGMITIQVDPTEEYEELKYNAIQRAEAIRAGEKRKLLSSDGTHMIEDNMLKVTMDLRLGSLDMRLINPNAKPGNKVLALCHQVLSNYQEHEDIKGAQVVFCDVGVPKKNKDTETTDEENIEEESKTDRLLEDKIYGSIKRTLIGMGIPENEIAFVHDAKNTTQRQALFDRVNSGEIRVLLGSTEQMGAGTNMQKRLVAAHHLDCPWRPRDIEQRNGRILRARNMMKDLGRNVKIYTYVTKGSLDAKMWERVKIKQVMIDSVLKGTYEGNDMEDISEDAASFGDISAMAQDDPRYKSMFELESKAIKLGIALNGLKDQRRNENQQIVSLGIDIKSLEKKNEGKVKDLKARQDVSGDKFKIKIGDKTFDDRTSAQQALLRTLDGFENTNNTQIGEFSGFKLMARYLGKKFEKEQSGNASIKEQYGLILSGNNDYVTSTPSIRALEGLLRSMDSINSDQPQIEKLKKELSALQDHQTQLIDQIHDTEKELASAKKEYEELSKELQNEDLSNKQAERKDKIIGIKLRTNQSARDIATKLGITYDDQGRAKFPDESVKSVFFNLITSQNEQQIVYSYKGSHTAKTTPDEEGMYSDRFAIPSDDFMLDENKPYEKQSKWVKAALQSLISKNAKKKKKKNDESTPTFEAGAFDQKSGSDILGMLQNKNIPLSSIGISGVKNGNEYYHFSDVAKSIEEEIKNSSKQSTSDYQNRFEMLADTKQIPDSQLTSREKSIQDLGKQLGVPVVFFEGNKNLHGYFAGGTSFINRNSATSLEWTFWHESFHAMQAQNPNLYNQILSEIKKSQSFTDKQIDAYRKEIGAFSLSDDEVIEEMLADNMQDAAKRSGIIDSLKGNRNLFQKFVDFVRDLYNQVKDYFNAPKNKLTQAQRDAMNRSVSRIASSMNKIGIKPLETVKMSANEIKENIERGKKAIEKILADHEDVNGAMTRPETGAIDFVWGEVGDPEQDFKHGRGISKILAKHGQKAVDMIPEVIARGTATYPTQDRVYFEHDGYRAVVRLDWDGEKKTWLVTNFENKKAMTAQKERENLDDADAFIRSAPTTDDTISAPELGSPLIESLPNEDDQIKFSINDRFNNINDTFARNLGLKPTSDRINVAESKPIDDINLKQYYLGSPSRIKNETFKFFFETATRGMRKLVQLRNKYARKFKDAMELLTDDKARDNLYELLWRGDEEGVEYGKLTSEEKRGKTVDEIDELRTDKIVRETGVARSAAKAYVKIRRLLEAVYRQLDARKRGVKTKTLYIQPKNLATFLKSFERNKFITVMRIGDRNSDGKIPVTIRQAQHWSKTAKNLTQAQVDQLASDPVIQITRSKKNSDGTFNITYRQGKAGLTRREGHIPHLFHHYTVRVKKKVNGEFQVTKDLEDRLNSYHAVIGSGKSQKDAIKVAEEWLKSNKLQDGEEIFIEPQMFNFEQFGQSESDYAPVMGDRDFHSMQRNIAKNHGMKLSDVKNLVAGSVRSTSRHRFNGYFLQRHGSKGFEQDIQYVLRHYLNSSARYLAMDEFKETSINKFEQAFGAFDKDWTDNSLAQYVKNYIRDVNGNPTTLEMTINNALNKSEIWKKYFIPHYGDRAALSLTNSITSRLGYLTLGFLNFSSALLNFSQLINAAGYLGEAGNLGKYFCKYMKGLKSGDGTLSMRDLSILTKVGTLNEIGLDSSSGYDQSRGHTSNIAALNLLDRFGNWSMGIFQRTDALCRIATTLAAYDQAKAQGKSDAEAIKYAREINRKSNFDYSVADAPNIFRRGSVIAQLALQFKKYGIKEIEVMADMLSSVTNKKQKAIFWGLYLAAVGLMGVPAGDGLDWLFKEFFGIGSPKNFAQECIMEVCGKSPEGKALGRALMYGIAGSVGVNISSRVGMQDVIPTRSSDLFGVAASKTYNLISDLFNEGFGMQAIRDVSPGAYNILAAGFGESRGKRGRLNSTYDDFFERALRFIGFKSTDETIASDVQRIIYDKRDKLSDDKQKAIDAYIEHPTTENARKLRKLGVKPKTVQEERKRKRMERLGRMDSLLSKKERRENRDLLNFAK